MDQISEALRILIVFPGNPRNLEPGQGKRNDGNKTLKIFWFKGQLKVTTTTVKKTVTKTIHNLNCLFFQSGV